MIVPMVRVFVAARAEQRARCLAALGRLGVLHPVPERALPADPPEVVALRRTEAALRALPSGAPTAAPPSAPAADLADLVLDATQRLQLARERWAELERETRRLGPWAGVSAAALRKLAEEGAELRVVLLPARGAAPPAAELVLPLGEHGGRTCVAVVGGGRLPAGCEVLDEPGRDAATLEREATEAADGEREARGELAALAGCRDALERERSRLRRLVEMRRVERGGHEDDALFAVAGWMPVAGAVALAGRLASEGIDAAVHWRDPLPEEDPPTLVAPPRWAGGAHAVARALGMAPGYREMDVSGVFALALPVFAGMITGDAGYGLLLLAGGMLARRRLARAVGAELAQLVVVFGGAAFVWGAVTGVWFGTAPDALAGNGALAPLAAVLEGLHLLRGTEAEVRTALMKICFLLGGAHLATAHLARAAALLPDRRALAELGWCIVLAGMLAVVWVLFFAPVAPWVRGLAVAGPLTGLALVTAFSVPHRSILPRLGLGFAGALLPFVGAFGDVLSYIRLMAVGLASYYLGSTTNLLAAGAAETATWAAGAPVLLFGHTLNLALVAIAIVAHGVRLNILEFSSHAGVQWAGVPYRPYREDALEELT